MAKFSGRSFNNVLIIFVIFFITLFNLPIVVDNYLKPTEPTIAPENDIQLIALFPKDVAIVSLEFSRFSLTKQSEQWRSSIPLNIPANKLVQHWLELSGTLVDAKLLAQLNANLPQSEWVIAKSATNQRYQLHYHQLPEFWLLQNWQGQWLAVTVKSEYLLPTLSN